MCDFSKLRTGKYRTDISDVFVLKQRLKFSILGTCMEAAVAWRMLQGAAGLTACFHIAVRTTIPSEQQCPPWPCSVRAGLGVFVSSAVHCSSLVLGRWAVLWGKGTMCALFPLLPGMKERERMPVITSNLGTRGMQEKHALEFLLANHAN